MATTKQKLVIGKLAENGGNLYRAMIAVGYADVTARSPSKLTTSKGFQELLDEKLPDDMLTNVHATLLSSKKLDHMVFPLGPEGEDDENLSGASPNQKNPLDDLDHPVERTTMTDGEITQMLSEVGCTVKRIVHGQTARHVYFWTSNDKARQDALKLAYDIKGKIKPSGEPTGAGNTYNTQINVNDSTPRGQQMVDAFTQFMQQQTKRKIADNE